MITKLTTPFVEAKDRYIKWLKTQDSPGYGDLLKQALVFATENESDFSYGDMPDVERIHQIDDGDWQGTLVFVIAAVGYQPNAYWVTKVGYGSCSGCDALEDAWGYSESDHDYEATYILTLHMMQGLVEV